MGLSQKGLFIPSVWVYLSISLLNISAYNNWGGQDSAAVKCPLHCDKVVGSNPAAAKRKTDIGEPPPQKVAHWFGQDFSGRLAM